MPLESKTTNNIGFFLGCAFLALHLLCGHVNAKTISPVTAAKERTVGVKFSINPTGVAYGLPYSAKPKQKLLITLELDQCGNHLDNFELISGKKIWTEKAFTLNRKDAESCVFQMKAPQRVSEVVGRHQMIWQPHYVYAEPRSIKPHNFTVRMELEITCSDSDLCNGEERYVNGKCLKAAHDLCDDQDACTLDFCTSNGVCNHTLLEVHPETNEPCTACFRKPCTPKCDGKGCGSDGCGGSCGQCSNAGEYCVNFQCGPVSIEGTCTRPIDMTNSASAINWNGVLVDTAHDTSKGVHILSPSCNAQSNAPEIVYLFNNTFGNFVGIEARMTDISGDPDALDTVLEIIEVPPNYPGGLAQGCLDSNKYTPMVVGCSDDSSPPGGLSSRITYVMKPGYFYYLVADGYSIKNVGPYRLQITLSNTGCSLVCAGKYCGSSQCQNYTCGDCDAETEICSLTSFKCVKSPCTPNCTAGIECGDDGCGGSCGSCGKGKLCVSDTGKCEKFESCDPMLPLCQMTEIIQINATYNETNSKYGCPGGMYCASDCQCRKRFQDIMDLMIVADAVKPEVVNSYEVTPNACSLQEKCIDQPGVRRIVKFSTNVGNQGRAHFRPPNPPGSYPQYYVWGACHGHWHFQGFANFQLLNMSGAVVVAGRKQSYCAEDSYRMYDGIGVSCEPRTTCDKQGVSKGWVDVYGPDLDCQFLDITNVPAGNYTIRQCTNQLRTFPEETFANNCVEVPFFLPPPPQQ